jgi:hypothetical protein
MSPAAAADGGRRIVVEMTGAEEAPGPGDPDGSGVATFVINRGQQQICYTLTVTDIGTPTAAHIHLAPVGVPGPVVVPLATPATGSSAACADVERSVAKDIAKNPSGYYVNVHNAEFPGGAVRGQLG